MIIHLVNRKISSFLLVIVLVISSFTPLVSQSAEKKLDVLFIHDMHSWLSKAPRVKTLVDSKKRDNPDTLFLDSGDFSMGTVYQTIFSQEATELRTLGLLGVDVTTIGNHEFDYGSKQLASMFQSALASGDKLPLFALCNIDWNAPDEGTSTVKKALVDQYGSSDYVVLQKGDVKIAVIGVFGKDALYCAPTCELTILDQVESVKKTVATIKQKEKVDMIACISHSGTSVQKSSSEDEILAKQVPELDLIISGHTHTSLTEPIIVGNTVIASCGAYLDNLGFVSLQQNNNGRWSITDYTLIPVNESIPEERELKTTLTTFTKTIDKDYFSQFGYSGSQVLALNDIQFHLVEDYQLQHNDKSRAKETPLITIGDVIANAYYNVINETQTNYKADLTVVPAGMIRGIVNKGNVTVESIYQTFSLGIGPDGIPGYPLITVYLTGKELKALTEIDATVSYFMPTAILYITGMSYKWNSHRLPFDKTTEVYINKDGVSIPAENDKLYSVVTDIYTGRMLAGLLKQTLGLISITPKDQNGNPITNIESLIIHTSDGKELKAWETIAMYLESLPLNGNTVPSIPEVYNKTGNYKIKSNSFNPVELLSGPSKLAIIVRLVVLVLAVIIALIITLCIHSKLRRASRTPKTE